MIPMVQSPNQILKTFFYSKLYDAMSHYRVWIAL